jgi:hypothetical protein
LFAVSLQVSLCVCLGLTQLIQCTEYRFAVKVSTCNNLPSKKIRCYWVVKAVVCCMLSPRPKGRCCTLQSPVLCVAVTKAQRLVLCCALLWCVVRCWMPSPRLCCVVLC